MYSDPYIGIKKPRIIFSDIKEITDNNYISINLYEMNRKNYYEVIYHYFNKEVFFGKYYKTDFLLDVSYKNGKILVFTKEYNRENYKMEIAEVLALYNIDDDMFYYCTEEEAIKIFDENLNTLYLKNKNRKVLVSHIKKRTLDPVINIDKNKQKPTKFIDISKFCLENIQKSNSDVELDKQKTKIIRLPK